MNIKLLKKLHKRFIWTKTDNDKSKAWTIFDKETYKEQYAFILGLYYYNDMAIEIMMESLRMKDKFVLLRDRQRRRKHNKRIKELQQKYNI